MFRDFVLSWLVSCFARQLLSLIAPADLGAMAKQQASDLQITIAAETLPEFLRLPDHRLPRVRQPVARRERRGGCRSGPALNRVASSNRDPEQPPLLSGRLRREQA